MDDHLSVCITLKNRAVLLDGFLEDLTRQDYDLKRIEICISDGFSTDNLKAVLEKHAGRFARIKYMLSDRSRLPFKVETNDPSADINAQVCWQPTYEKIIRTDAEIRFPLSNTFRFVAETLNNRDTAIALYGFATGAEYDYVKEPSAYREYTVSSAARAGYCMCFNRHSFMESKGIDEGFAKGFAAGDNAFHDWWQKNKTLITPESKDQHVVHLWHGEAWKNPEWLKLRDTVSVPLWESIRDGRRSHNEDNPDWKRPEMLSGFEVFPKQPKLLTIHAVVRNEPFVYYAVKSVYPFADEILLYDTGSYDDHTMNDIKDLLREDIEHKIRFKEVPIDIDETKWKAETVGLSLRTGRETRCVGTVRQMQLDDTKTPFAMILDGDEIWPINAMEHIRRVVENWPKDKITAYIRHIWMYDPEHYFDSPGYRTINGYPITGRILVNDAFKMRIAAPACEMHVSKKDGRIVTEEDPAGFIIKSDPMLHWETYVKPWRRIVPKDKIHPYFGDLPEVMRYNPYYMNRYRNESGHIRNTPMLSGKKNVVFVSYYTNDYTQEAQRLAQSLVKWGLDYDIQHIASKGSWTANTYYKPKFIYDKMLEYWDDYDALCWIDADGEVLDNPEEILNLDRDLGLCFLTHEGGGIELCAGTISVTLNSSALCVVGAWVRACSTPDTNVLEQVQLQKILSEFPSNTIHPFDRRYIAIKGHGVKHPIIFHHQHSRETRRQGNM